MKITGSPDQADDLVQDCIERALRKADLYQPGTNLRAWLFTIMRNTFINNKRREKVVRRHADSVRAEGASITQPNQITRVFLNQTMSALSGFGADEQDAMWLLGVEERSHQYAAETLNLPVGTMKSRLFRARTKLRAQMGVGEPGVFDPTTKSSAA